MIYLTLYLPLPHQNSHLAAGRNDLGSFQAAEELELLFDLSCRQGASGLCCARQLQLWPAQLCYPVNCPIELNPCLNHAVVESRGADILQPITELKLLPAND